MNESPDQPIQKYHKAISSNDLSGYWFDAYGWITCYFAQLEGLSYALIDLLVSSENECARLNRLPFKKRTEQAKLLVCRHLIERGDESLAEEWHVLLSEAKDAAPMRNKILHNPMHVNLALGDRLLNEDVGITVIHEHGRPVLKLGTVQAFAKSMHELNIRMQDLMTRSQLTT